VWYDVNSGVTDERSRKRLREIPLSSFEVQTGLSRHTIVRARRGHRLYPRSIYTLRRAARICEHKSRSNSN